MRVAGRIAAAGAGRGRPAGRARGDHRRARPGRPRVPVSTTAPTRRRWATRASRSRCAPRSTRSSATASRTPPALRDGDIVNIDITAYIDGVHGDTDATYLVGDVDEESRLLVERTREALTRAIKAVAPGPPDQRHRPGHRVVRRALRLRRRPGLHRPRHRHVLPLRAGRPALRRPARTTTVIEPGMTFTIEPMLTLGTHDWRHVGRRLDGRHQGPQALGAVRAHAAGDRDGAEILTTTS